MLQLTKTRTELVLDEPFFGSLVFKLTPLETTAVQTMGTDGCALFYNAEFVKSLPLNQLLGVYCHEILHCSLSHHTRRGGRDPSRWNAACDYAVNILILDEFKMALPKDRLYSEEYRGMSAEQIYNLLPERATAPSWGAVMDAASNAEHGTVQEQEASWDTATAQAAQAAKAAGKLPDYVETILKKAKAKVNWREQLRTLVGSVSKTDYQWYPGDHRYVHKKLFLPCLQEPTLGHLVVALDTSASVRDQELSQFLGELQSIVDEQHRDSLTVIHCDSEIRKIETIEEGETIAAKVAGRGGTCFAPVFDYCDHHPVDALIYFTDLEPNDGFPKEPSYPVFWGRTQDKTPPYGHVIDVFRV